MAQKDKSKEELFEEIKLLQKRIAELETPASSSKQQQQQQQQQQIRRLATVVRDSNDAITLKDFDGRIIAWNHGAELMYGYSEEEALQMNVRQLTPPDKEVEHAEFIRRLEAGETIASFETQRVSKDGRILDVWLTVTKVLDDDGKPVGIASTERDVTERNKAKAELVIANKKLAFENEEKEKRAAELEGANKEKTKLNEDLERSNKELEQFVHIASHDLQAPLRTMTSFIELLARRYKGKLDTQADEFIAYIVQDALRMQTLIESLLELTRVDTACGMLIETDSASALRAALDNLRSAIDSSGAIITSNDMPVLVADASQLIQLFQNLVDNGIKFCCDEKPHINVSARREGAAWLFTVADNGIGVEPQYVDDVLQMTRKLVLRDKYPGSGFGLSIC